MGKKITESEALEKLNNLLPDHIKFINWEGENWNYTRKTKVNLYCNKHNKYFSLGYNYLIHLNNEVIGCPECLDVSKKIAKGISKSKKGEEVIKSLIKNIIPDDVTFLGWIDDWISINKTEAKFYCNTHKKEFTLKCRVLKDHKTIRCPECKKTFKKKINPELEKRSENNIKSFINKNPHIEFLGIDGGKFLGINKTKINLRCKKHNYKFTSPLSSIIRYINKDYCCPECIKENVSLRRKLTPEKAQELVNEKYKKQNPGFDYSNIEKTFTGYKDNVKLVCPKHGEFEITFQSLIDKRYNTCCPTCKLEELSYTKEQAINKVNDILEYKNSIGFDLSFLGFFNDEWTGNTTRLILHCNKHNYTWNTTNFNNFMKKSMLGCHICAAEHRGISLKEEMCYKLISKFINNKDIQRQYRFIVFDKICNIERTIFVDFYIKSLNLIIEYDGEQHFMFLLYFQLNEDGYKNQVNRDNCLNNYCKENNINLLRIPYVDNNRLEEVIEKYFTTGEDITTKIQPKLLPIKYEEKKLWM